MNQLAAFYSGKTVFVTGHTGFKGSWLSLWLRELGARVVGYSLPPETTPNLHELLPGGDEHLHDIRDQAYLEEAVLQAKPDFVFHLAAQPLVRRSYVEPLATMETNVMGTLYLLESLRKLNRAAPLVVITTDKCYENHGWDYGYRESDGLGGHDVYSMSKAACELAVASWRRCFFDTAPGLGPVVTARAGNVIGGGDYAQDRIVPDCVRAVLAGESLALRNPASTRPWQHVLDCLSGYLWLGVKLAAAGPRSPFASAFNFGPALESNVSVQSLVTEFSKHWPVDWKDVSDPKAAHESSRLHLSIDKAAALLNWHPTWNLQRAVEQTALWYKEQHTGTGTAMPEYSLAQIRAFTADAAAKGAPWIQ